MTLSVDELQNKTSLWSELEERTRGHGVTLAKKRCRLYIRIFIFTKNSKRMEQIIS